MDQTKQDNNSEISSLDLTLSQTSCSTNFNQSLSTHFGNYLVKEPIGRGAGSFVLRLESRRSHNSYALKVIDKNDQEYPKHQLRILQEIKIHKKLEHPNIIKLIKTAEDSDYHYLMLEYCPKGDLYSLLKEKQILNENETKEISLQISKGLEYLHQQNIIHRDLKLGNILIKERPLQKLIQKQKQNLNQNLNQNPNNNYILSKYEVKICDFGLAIQLNNFEEERDTICGTPNYISPEILKGEKYSFKIDIWSLGCIIYSLLKGQAPFQGQTVRDTLNNIKNQKFQALLSGFSPQMKSLLSGCLQYNPKLRFSITQVLNEIIFQQKKLIRCQGQNSFKAALPPLPLKQKDFLKARCNTVDISVQKEIQQFETNTNKNGFFKETTEKKTLKKLTAEINERKDRIFIEPTAVKKLDFNKTQNTLQKSEFESLTKTEKFQQQKQINEQVYKTKIKNQEQIKDNRIKTEINLTLDLESTAFFSTDRSNNNLSKILQNTDLSKRISTIDSNNSISLSNVKDLSPLSINKIAPIQFITQQGLIEITKFQTIQIEIQNGKYFIEISQNGQDIKVYQREKFPFMKQYCLEDLPYKYKNIYEYAKKITQVLYEKEPKLKYETKEGVFILQQNNIFKAYYKDGSKALLDIKENNISINTKFGLQIQLNLFKDISLVSSEIKYLVIKTIKNAKLLLKQ